jgi:hypothetical protein
MDFLPLRFLIHGHLVCATFNCLSVHSALHVQRVRRHLFSRPGGEYLSTLAASVPKPVGPETR